MSSRPTLPISPQTEDRWLQTLSQPPTLKFEGVAAELAQVNLIRLDEINEEGHQAYRQALANVYASLDASQPLRLLYILDGSPTGTDLYFGVIANPGGDTYEGIKNLRGALEGQLPGINFGEDFVSKADCEALLTRINRAPNQGIVLGAPSGLSADQPESEQNFQGMDRLVRTMQSGSSSSTQGTARWQVIVVSQPLSRQQIRHQLDEAYALSSRLAALVRTSVQASGNTSRQKGFSSGTSEARGTSEGSGQSGGKNEGASLSKNYGKSSSSNSSSSSRGTNSGESQTKTVGTNEGWSTNEGTSHTDTTSENYSLSDTTGSTLGITQEIANKRAQHLMEHLDKQLIARLRKGLTKGMFCSAVYVTADHQSAYQRLKNAVRATFQGVESTLSPLEVHDLPQSAHGHLLQLPQPAELPLPMRDMLFHNLYGTPKNGMGSLLTADELATVASLPQRELQGIRRRKTVDFIVDLPDIDDDASLDLGEVIDRGRRYPNNRVRLVKKDLNTHTFVTGVTGAGKTNTCLNLLLESDLPFLVIEPVKTEYRELSLRLKGIDYYRPNGDSNQSLRINPFALLRRGQRIKSHAGFLKNVFAAVFPMEASMPMMVEAAIFAAYEEKGWDLDANEFLLDGDPFDPLTRAWPTMSDMIRLLDVLLPTYGLGQDLLEKYRGSLVSRLRSLTDGTLGQVLDVPQSLDFQALLQGRAVIELEELQSGEEKALLMALLLGCLYEGVRDLHQQNPEFRQLTLVEEAHRLLSRPEPGDKGAAMAVESFADMLAEVRKYGAGLIIADQIPAKLIPDVIKNTHTKIVHRLFAEDDRRAMGESMMMDDEQRDYLPNLAKGEAIVFCGGWHGSAHAKIRNDKAQSDNHLLGFELDRHGVGQLWRHRERYYPQFCRLGWLSQEGAPPATFAKFVRDTRQAQNQLLHVLGDQEQRSRHAFHRLKQWFAEWQPQAAQAQERQRSECGEEYPEALLAAAWMTLLLDANPRPHAKQSNVRPLNLESERSVLCAATERLLAHLESSDTLDDFHDRLKQRHERELSSHCIHLQMFKSF